MPVRVFVLNVIRSALIWASDDTNTMLPRASIWFVSV